MLNSIWLIAKSVLIEAMRRKEIYAIVLSSCVLIGFVMSIDFFHLEGLTKFYREIALKVMGIATALTVIVLAARQLPREFENRTIYPLLAKPISRFTFLAGKLLGVMLAGCFCYALFITVFLIGTFYLKGEIPWVLLFQHIYLQTLMLLVLATLCFWFSMFLNFDAAVTIGFIFYASANAFSSVINFLYDTADPLMKVLLLIGNYGMPQLTLFDLSSKVIHAQKWDPIGWQPILILTIYALVFSICYYSFAMICFRRKPL